jgi:hypothetical protein
MLKLALGLGVPFAAIVLALPLINQVSFTVYNIPFLYLWLFAWFVLTSGCLGACWFLFDRRRAEEEV